MSTAKTLALAGLLLAVPAASAAEGEAVTFTYAPPEGVVVERTVKRSNEVRRGDDAYLDVSLLRDERVAEKTADGYTIRRTVLENTLERDGTPITSPMLGAMAGLELVYTIDSDGRATDIQGYDAILEKLKTTLPGPFVSQIASLFNKEGLRQRDIAQWNAELGEQAGSTVALGERRAERAEMTLPSGQKAPYYTLDIYDSWVDCGDGARCLKIRTLYHHDPVALAELGGDGAAAALEQAGWDGEALAGEPLGEVTGEGERLVDPATMELYGQTSKKTLDADVTLPGSGETHVRTIEKTKYEYQRRPAE